MYQVNAHFQETANDETVWVQGFTVVAERATDAETQVKNHLRDTVILSLASYTLDTITKTLYTSGEKR